MFHLSGPGIRAQAYGVASNRQKTKVQQHRRRVVFGAPGFLPSDLWVPFLFSVLPGLKLFDKVPIGGLRYILRLIGGEYVAGTAIWSTGGPFCLWWLNPEPRCRSRLTAWTVSEWSEIENAPQ